MRCGQLATGREQIATKSLAGTVISESSERPRSFYQSPCNEVIDLPELEAEARKRQLETLKQYASVTPPMGERQGIKGEAIDAAAAIVGVCGSSVQQAKAVRTRDPEALLDSKRLGR